MPHGNAFRSYFWSILNKTTLLNTGTGARLQQQQQMAMPAAAAAGDGGAATANSTAQRMTAGIIVIGDEILKGSTMDSNSHYLCRHLHNRGVLVKKISVIGDHVPEIACEVRKFSGDFDIVFTTGGIGPTHDDKTFEGLASAFGEELTTSEELKAVVEIFLRKTKLRNVHEAVEKFCRLPRSAQLIWGSQRPPANPDQLTNFPSVQIHNVIALPGVPRFCEQSFELLEEHLFPTPKMSAFFSKDIYLRKNEIHLQQRLTQIADKHTSQGVSIGSYPVMGHSYFKTRLSVDSNSAEAGQAAVEELNREFSDWIVSYDPQPWENCAHKLEKFREQQSSKEFADKIDDAVQTIDQILDKYSLDKIALSFNGGKDCTLLLHLFRASVDRKHGKQTPIEGFFIEGDDEFPKVVTFVRNVSKSYNLTILEVPGTMKAGLARLKSERPNVVAVLMGSRSTDPKACHMKSKCEWTDADWPSFIRVCPLLDWSYADIWRALRGLCIPYCPLYDQGYSSLGERSKTAKNPHLKDKSREDRYLPAYMLEDGNLERAFREERPPDSSSSK